ncbi:pentapeptide repeat-containing protein [Nonomuraea sp. NPDC048826]|uniref:pentapeptide repeat-containing protein n=1 Tax=Nonomuraea sp. NPDC048826 TaxID=3364347 RepID=UPI00371496DF
MDGCPAQHPQQPRRLDTRRAGDLPSRPRFRRPGPGSHLPHNPVRALLTPDPVLGAAGPDGAGLGGEVLRGAVLRGAVLRGAVLRGAVLRGAVLRGAVLRGAVLRGGVLGDPGRGHPVLGHSVQGHLVPHGPVRGVRGDVGQYLWDGAECGPGCDPLEHDLPHGRILRGGGLPAVSEGNLPQVGGPVVVGPVVKPGGKPGTAGRFGRRGCPGFAGQPGRPRRVGCPGRPRRSGRRRRPGCLQRPA